MSRNTVAVILTLVSFVCFVPGIFLPIFSLNLDGSIQTQLGGFDLQILNQQSSILQTVEQLVKDGRVLVGVLILLFSVIIPMTKALLLLLAHFTKNQTVHNKAHAVANAIGKWSMADVMVVAVFLAFLSTHGDTQINEQALNIMGMKIPVKATLNLQSSLGEGFYYFLGYCLISITSFQLFRPNQDAKQAL